MRFIVLLYVSCPRRSMRPDVETSRPSSTHNFFFLRGAYDFLFFSMQMRRGARMPSGRIRGF